jgi:hypothetical protein
VFFYMYGCTVQYCPVYEVGILTTRTTSIIGATVHGEVL